MAFEKQGQHNQNSKTENSVGWKPAGRNQEVQNWQDHRSNPAQGYLIHSKFYTQKKH